MVAAINTYILYSPLEKDRTARVEAMRQQFKQFTISESIYPSNTHIPFLKAIIEKSKERTGKSLMATEVACLLGHRRKKAQYPQLNLLIENTLQVCADQTLDI